jgi:hypothetical protein
VNDLLTDRVALPATREHLLDTLYREQSWLDCNACGYRGPWEHERVAKANEADRSST